METDESSSALPARPVYMKTKNSSQALRLGIAMPKYTIAEDPPWVTERASHAPKTASIYSEEYDEAPNNDRDAPHVSKASYHPSYHAHPQQQIMDNGPQTRSRLPLFNHVKSMLQKPPALPVTSENARWDDLSGQLPETGRPAEVNPPTYVSPYDRVFGNRKRSPERRSKHDRSLSPAFSILHDDEVKPPAPLRIGRKSPRNLSPVSRISPVSPSDFGAPSPRLDQERSEPAAAHPHKPVISIKRKPTPSALLTKENVEPERRLSASSDWTEPLADDEQDTNEADKSHFSWTTYATSVIPGRSSIDSRHTNHISVPDRDPKSHFSWSTVNTTATRQQRPPSPPPSIPSKYSTPNTPQSYSPRGVPVMSILSRQRPIQRLEKPDWTPPPPKKHSGTSTPRATTTTTTPFSAIHPALRTTSSLPDNTNQTTPPQTKRLPPPPTPTEPQSHLETLLAQEQDVTHQRRNIAKTIHNLELIQKASPMEVSWHDVQEAKKKLVEQRGMLAELGVEERELGVKIARVRRREGEGGEEGLWVRRVTG
ncbi:hypothetical protein LTR62_002148 [Meristemomyces frigidus]|uniref:Uncharacterized protein n=1 Tax=Meristemomyces frigidus TaxID=1508187 RepID=A0AAN7YFW7_9PEZI|nr:hypothetical protein LTR62_002148 [Meristemomyces frigidus]